MAGWLFLLSSINLFEISFAESPSRKSVFSPQYLCYGFSLLFFLLCFVIQTRGGVHLGTPVPYGVHTVYICQLVGT